MKKLTVLLFLLAAIGCSSQHSSSPTTTAPMIPGSTIPDIAGHNMGDYVSWCDHGNRLYSARSSWDGHAVIAVAAQDPSCKEGQR